VKRTKAIASKVRQQTSFGQVYEFGRGHLASRVCPSFRPYRFERAPFCALGASPLDDNATGPP